MSVRIAEDAADKQRSRLRIDSGATNWRFRAAESRLPVLEANFDRNIDEFARSSGVGRVFGGSSAPLVRSDQHHVDRVELQDFGEHGLLPVTADDIADIDKVLAPSGRRTAPAPRCSRD